MKEEVLNFYVNMSVEVDVEATLEVVISSELGIVAEFDINVT